MSVTVVRLKNVKPLPATLALQDGPPVKTHVLYRGDYSQPGDEVLPAFPEVLREGTKRNRHSEEKTPLPSGTETVRSEQAATLPLRRLCCRRFAPTLQLGSLRSPLMASR